MVAAGPIGFVGLVVPLVACWLACPDLRWVLPYSILVGCVPAVSDAIFQSVSGWFSSGSA